jgi:hypothetical protein
VDIINKLKHREEKTTIIWPCQEDARENTKINFGMGAIGEAK